MTYWNSVTGEVVNDIDDNLATNSEKVQLDIGTMTKPAERWVTFVIGSTDVPMNFVPTRGYEIMRSSSGTVSFTGQC